MSSQKTEHLGLHAWEPSDSFLRNEFNDNFSAIDAAVGALEGKAEVVTGSYVGDGAASRFISLGFTPRAVMVVTRSGLTFVPGMLNYRVGGVFLPGMDLDIFRIVSGGFRVYYLEELGNYSLNSTDEAINPYYYIAVK